MSGDAETKTLTFTGTSFDTDLSALPYANEVETLVLDNPEMVVQCTNTKFTNTSVENDPRQERQDAG